MILVLADPVAGAVPRDVVIEEPSAMATRISAGSSTARYPVNDGSGATIAIDVTAACQVSCTDADPQRIADFIGTLIHGFEIDLLTVQLDAPYQIDLDCGFGANACYYGSESKIVISGDDTPTPDGASREYVLAHEYGHHVARHRENPSPFLPPLDWGTARWSSYEHICQRSRARLLFPGNGILHYFRDPGEAFAEAFARNRLPDSGVRWRWLPALEPDAAAFQAMRRDTLDPWLGRTSFLRSGRVPPPGRGAAIESLHTPLDGTVSLRPSGTVRRHYQLSLRSPSGRVLRSSRHGLSLRRQLNFTVCGQSRLRVQLKSKRRSGVPFELLIQRP